VRRSALGLTSVNVGQTCNRVSHFSFIGNYNNALQLSLLLKI